LCYLRWEPVHSNGKTLSLKGIKLCYLRWEPVHSNGKTLSLKGIKLCYLRWEPVHSNGKTLIERNKEEEQIKVKTHHAK
jgi:hypothetical protein